MNEECMDTTYEDTPCAPQNEASLAQTETHEEQICGDEQHGTDDDGSQLAPPPADNAESVEATPFFTDSTQDPDPDPQTAIEPSQPNGLDELRSELIQLRAEVASRNAFFERLGVECEEFRALYPNTSLSSLPDTVWQDVQKGVPIAAAYALAERRRALTEETAKKINAENQARSSGGLTSTANEYFSPAEVRSMTPGEVRENYQKIMRSMQNWH